MNNQDLPLFSNTTKSEPGGSSAMTVSEITAKIKNNLENDFYEIWVKGEVSNYKPAASGHVYFSLKDETASIAVAAFGWNKRSKKPTFELKDGLEVLCRGNVSVYPPRGNYQLLVDTIEPVGAGALQLAFDQLKDKLMKDGLFDQKRKRPLPKYPKKLVVITSPQAAALRDVLTVLRRRAPFVEVVLIPALVQGEDAPAKLIQAIRVANRYKLGEAILLTRGGGSIEDLWGFNHEELARTIAASEIPLVSAVGHEVDFTIADFVADLRAPTPSAGAEILTQHWVELRERTRQNQVRLVQGFRRELQMKRRILETLAAKLKSPQAQLREKIQKTDELAMGLERGIRLILERKLTGLERLSLKLNALSPLNVLSRGYALVQDEKGHVVRHASDTRAKQLLKLRFSDGEIEVRTIE